MVAGSAVFDLFCRRTCLLENHNLLNMRHFENTYLRAIPTRASSLIPACDFLCRDSLPKFA